MDRERTPKIPSMPQIPGGGGALRGGDGRPTARVGHRHQEGIHDSYGMRGGHLAARGGNQYCNG